MMNTYSLYIFFNTPYFKHIRNRHLSYEEMANEVLALTQKYYDSQFIDVPASNESDSR